MAGVGKSAATVAEHALDLDQAVIDVLSKPCTAAHARAVLDRAEEERGSLQTEADAADVASLSPLATRAHALELRGKANDLRFEADRLDASVSALSVRLDELEKGEARSIRRREADAATVERDALAADIAEKYPRIVKTLTQLVQRIHASDARCQAAGLRDIAENIARGPLFGLSVLNPPMRLQDIRLPLAKKGGYWAWDDTVHTGPRYMGLDTDAEGY